VETGDVGRWRVLWRWLRELLKLMNDPHPVAVATSLSVDTERGIW